MYDYKVIRVIKVVDGDTCDLSLDLGFYLSTGMRFRLLGCDAPEHKEAGWQECKDLLATFLQQQATTTIYAKTVKSDHFGRWLADLYVIHDDGTEDHYADRLNAIMAENGWTSPSVR